MTRRQAGTAEGAAAVAVGGKTKEHPTVAVEVDLSAAASSSSFPTSTTTTAALAMPSASPSATKGDSPAAQHLGLVNPWDVPEVPRAGVVRETGKRGKGAGEGEADSRNDGAEEYEENEKGRKTDTWPGGALETALLQFAGEAASKTREAGEKEKERSSLTGKLDLAVSDKYR